MPEKLAELKFTGEVPVSLQFVKLAGQTGFRKIQMKATNRTNKDIQSIRVLLDFLGPDGQKLKDGNSSAAGNRILVKTDDTVQIELPAFFMPEAAVSAVGRVESIEFSDATQWNAE